MTVAELIKVLESLPQDKEIFFKDWASDNLEEPSLHYHPEDGDDYVVIQGEMP